MTIDLRPTWNAKAKRWESDRGRYWFDTEAADRITTFFPRFLSHYRGEFAGMPFDLLEYQRVLLRMAFGWKRSSDGLRRFRKIFLAVPKGNGKSPFGAGIGIYLATADGEAGAEVYAAAADRRQAQIVFENAKIMVQQNAALSARAEVYAKSIVFPAAHSHYEVLSADAPTKHGFNVHGLIFDEFHAQPDRELYETLYRGIVKRRQPMCWLVTTAGDDDESICFEEWDYGRAIQSGTIQDPTFLPFIFEAGPEEDWTQEELHRRVNPGYGVTVKADAIRTECQAAQNEPRKRNDFLRFHLNRWVSQAIAWLPLEDWDACAGELDMELLATLPCAGGLDMAQKIDLASFVVAFLEKLEADGPEIVLRRERAGGGGMEEVRLPLRYRVHLVPHFWIPEETMAKREKEDRVPYGLWAEQGLLTPTEGVTIDYNRIHHDIAQIAERFPKLKAGEIGYDPAFATDVAQRLAASGFRVVETLQNYGQLSEPSQVFEGLVYARRLRHDGHRLLRWCVENVAIKQDDAGRIRPVKPKKGSRKRIDGVVAGIMALKRVLAMGEPEPEKAAWDGRSFWA